MFLRGRSLREKNAWPDDLDVEVEVLTTMPLVTGGTAAEAAGDGAFLKKKQHRTRSDQFPISS